MRELGGQIDLPIHVYGPETHMTAIVAMALGQEPIEDPKPTEVSTANFSLPSMVIIDFNLILFFENLAIKIFLINHELNTQSFL